MRSRIPVLIAGGGSVGLAAALFLAHHGVEVTVVERQEGPSVHPRATGIGPRTMEMFRAIGIEAAVNAAAVAMAPGSRGKVYGATLAQADFAAASPAPRMRGDGADTDVSPGRLRGLCAQHRLDAVLLAAARERGADVRYATRLVDCAQDGSGVDAVLETADGARSPVRADFLVAADGARSGVRAALGIAVSGPGVIGESLLNILFRADLSHLTGGVGFVNCTIANPAAPGLLVTVDGARDWVFHTPCDTDGGRTAAEFTPRRCRELVRAAVGDADLDVEVRSVLAWRARGQLAERFAAGRVFLVGDAAHTVPPIGAFGLNTGIADAHNLAWKLAAVCRGQAGRALLGTYHAERHPVAAHTLDQAMRRHADPALHWATGPEADAARAAAGVLPAPRVHLGYRYASAAVVDPVPAPPVSAGVAALFDGAPGSRVPHVWLDRAGRRLSTVDLAAPGFAVLAGPDGVAWVDAAPLAAERLGMPVAAEVVAAAEDPDGRWPRAAGLDGDGALLVRPDGFVAWRSQTAGPPEALTTALAGVLARSPSPTVELEHGRVSTAP